MENATITVTAREFAAKSNTEYPIAYGFLRFLAENGAASIERIPNKSGRGKNTVLYTINLKLLGTFSNKLKEVAKTLIPIKAEESVPTHVEPERTEPIPIHINLELVATDEGFDV